MALLTGRVAPVPAGPESPTGAVAALGPAFDELKAKLDALQGQLDRAMEVETKSRRVLEAESVTLVAKQLEALALATAELEEAVVSRERALRAGEGGSGVLGGVVGLLLVGLLFFECAGGRPF